MKEAKIALGLVITLSLIYPVLYFFPKWFSSLPEVPEWAYVVIGIIVNIVWFLSWLIILNSRMEDEAEDEGFAEA